MGKIAALRRRSLDVGRRLAPMVNARLGRRSVAHFGLHHPANAGDTLLFVATRDLIDRVTGAHRWGLEPLRRLVTAREVDRINGYASAVVVGGGGLLLADTNANTNSGWQWNVGVGDLERIVPPLIVFGIGYNRFRGQPDFAPVFTDHITRTVDRALFFGLRNRGSVAALGDYVPADLRMKLCWQPCPTTLLRSIYRLEPRPTGGIVTLNCAFDRRPLRYGDPGQEVAIRQRLVAAARLIVAAGADLVVTLHDKGDGEIVRDLVDGGIVHRVRNLRTAPAAEIVRFYESVDLAIGMRGHSQLIPFGVGTGILSLISHDKVGWFLDDIGRRDWGLDIRSPELAEALGTAAVQRLETGEEDRQFVARRQQELWAVTVDNVNGFASALEASRAG